MSIADTTILDAIVPTDYAAVTFGAQWNGSPDRQTLCRITDSLRAKATRALPGPEAPLDRLDPILRV